MSDASCFWYYDNFTRPVNKKASAWAMCPNVKTSALVRRAEPSSPTSMLLYGASILSRPAPLEYASDKLGAIPARPAGTSSKTSAWYSPAGEAPEPYGNVPTVAAARTTGLAGTVGAARAFLLCTSCGASLHAAMTNTTSNASRTRYSISPPFAVIGEAIVDGGRGSRFACRKIRTTRSR